MRVFVTGGTGFVGKAVVKHLLDAGHVVIGLARSDKAAEELSVLGAEIQRGSLLDLDILGTAAANSDGVIHLAFIHDFSNFAKSCQIDQEAIRAMGDALAGSNRPLIITSGTMLLPHGRLAAENDTHDTSSPAFAARGESESLGRALASKGVRTAIMRLAPVNHGDGDDHMFMARLVTTARDKGMSVYIGDGKNRWPAVHVLDTATAYLAALEKAEAGATFHIVAEEGVAMKNIADVIGKKLGVPIVSKTMQDAQEHYGSFLPIVSTDNPTSSKNTQEVLGWIPRQCGLLEDLEHGGYFE